MGEYSKPLIMLRPMVNAGEFAINTASGHIFELDEEKAATVNSGYSNDGPKNVQSVICQACKKRPAKIDPNGTDEYFCMTCYNRQALGL